MVESAAAADGTAGAGLYQTVYIVLGNFLLRFRATTTTAKATMCGLIIVYSFNMHEVHVREEGMRTRRHLKLGPYSAVRSSVVENPFECFV